MMRLSKEARFHDYFAIADDPTRAWLAFSKR
jgi:hypothetical protein